MAGYITLGKYTQKGLASIKDIEQGLKDSRAGLEKLGIRLVGFWLTLGEYDYVAIVDTPDEKALATFLLALGQGGLTATQTMRAFSEDEIAQIVKRLP